MLLSTPVKIKTLQRKLYTKAKQDPEFCFYVLYDKVSREDVLNHAYALVRSNGGAAGVDGRTIEQIEAQEGKEAFLATLGATLRDKTYQAMPVRRIWIPKSDGSSRPLGIPTIKDRVVQTAVKLMIEPIFEAGFCEHSYGFRPKRTAHHAVDAVSMALHKRRYHVIDADLSKYFDTIPHAKLMSAVAERVSDGSILKLLKQWLAASVIEEDKSGVQRHHPAGGGKRCGTPQGGVISPLLANVYLHLLDRLWERHDLSSRYNAELVRYADDMVICCGGNPDKPLQMLKMVLSRLGLSLNESKTRVVDARKEAFDFLGFSIRYRKSRVSGNWYPHVEPSERSFQRVKAKCRLLIHRRLTAMPLVQLMARLNRVLRGWCNYFHYRNSSGVLSRLKYFVEGRVRDHMRRRFKLYSRVHAFKRFPTKSLYELFGLYAVPTTAGWR